MSKEHNHIEHLTPELIRQYRAGELSETMSHAVEKYLLENPFEAEAFEGLELIANENVAGHVAELHERIDQKTKTSSIDKGATEFWAYTRKIAATILLMLVAGLAFVWLRPAIQKSPMTKELTELNSSDEEDSPSKKEEKVSKSLAAPTPAPPPAEKSEEKQEERLEVVAEKEPEVKRVLTPDTNEEPTAKADGPVLENMQATAAQNQAEYKKREAAFAEEMSNQRAKASQRIIMTGTQSSGFSGTAPASAIVTTFYDSTIVFDTLKNGNLELSNPIFDPDLKMSFSNSASPIRTNLPDSVILPIYGKVTDAVSGKALAGAVITSGPNRRSLSDENGIFMIEPDSSSRLLNVSFSGYSPKEYYGILGTNLMTVTLNPSSKSLEGRTLNYSSLIQKSKAKQSAVSIPIITTKEFDNYVLQNLRYPEAARSRNIKGRVVLDFTINAQGEITAIEVVKGLGYGCDEEAIRLLQEGPTWLPNTNKKTGQLEERKERVKIRFRP